MVAVQVVIQTGTLLRARNTINYVGIIVISWHGPGQTSPVYRKSIWRCVPLELISVQWQVQSLLQNCQDKKAMHTSVIGISPKPGQEGETHTGVAECCSQGDWTWESRSAGVRAECPKQVTMLNRIPLSSLAAAESGPQLSGVINCYMQWASRELSPLPNPSTINLLVLKISWLCQTRFRFFKRPKPVMPGWNETDWVQIWTLPFSSCH